MLGKDLFKVESNVDLSIDKYKALILFYNPLIGNDAQCLYEFLAVKGNSIGFEELSKLLNSLNISIDQFDNSIKKLNEYKLIKTLKKRDEDKYIFVLNNPLNFDEFVNDDLFVRDFILKRGGLYYQSIISDIRVSSNHKDFEDVSEKFKSSTLQNWTEKDEQYLNKPSVNNSYNFNTLFDINVFLKDISNTLLPIKYRTIDNLKMIATLADLYNISYDKMRSFIPKVAKSDSNNFDTNLLKTLCMNSTAEFSTIDEGIYNVPCQLFLMNKQEGKEVSPYDKKIIFKLANEYNLSPSVINVLLEYTLNNCKNRLLESYLYPIASDMHRNDIKDYKEALERLNNTSSSKTKIIENTVDYNSFSNPVFDEDAKKALRDRRKNG